MSLSAASVEDSLSLDGFNIKDGDESDVDEEKLPSDVDMAVRVANSLISPVQGSPSKRRSAGPVEKEQKRIKRLLRNRVSAQQARERKKAYLIDLENKIKEFEQRNAELEEKVSTLQHENYMLRQIVKNTTIRRETHAVPGLTTLEDCRYEYYLKENHDGIHRA